ncbi:MAG: alanine dehydrogenase [Epsilonproteobacteria bacterium]|nr:alanine dehydrogenase [Campylobacterota bacterium]OIO17756.1 MAG: alanine dehydrogenase [Helicobacteraceae bacterium CG1_02_36_14]PIP11138.1 MAG: alanine dehydrogenase [Sulfurimonas sp. CG23_combo_of_CG06-09_8_20_14_all_36_33]PIS24784.1 MAG: alanine dehydrogenase [Sulfurimonas sp. CG08_land_8_20_14_0_20_36_33]PIU33665.1 MAG: alanine dehydrogenase [Sulfurimonas sp. CG07_land_8_20_14_0_80_36_56]PIV03511.1 MAG: alanine dehydrogenase [Sulfurimonas sp. CG03_land_8_20_14_0_80_36_25]PIV35651.1 MA
MKIGVPKEIKTDEYRVAVTPAGVKELVHEKHMVYIQRGAGEGSGFSDAEYADAGAELLDDVAELFTLAEMIVKVKEPIAIEYKLFKPNQTLFTYLHLAADRELTEFLLEKGIRAFSYETLNVNGRLPLLEPMSEVAGKMASLMGAVHLGRYHGGSGLLIGGVVGTPRAKVMVLGGGVAGKAAAEVAAGLGADVTIMDINTQRLHYLNDVMPANVATIYSSSEAISSLLPHADIVVGTVLIPGAKAPKLISKEMLKGMKKGSVLVDVSIDQGGCFESSHPTTHSNPTFTQEGIVHYCVANMPGAYPRTSTYALTNVTLSYIKDLAKYGAEEICSQRAVMISSLNTYDGVLHNRAVGVALGIPSV